MLGGEARYQLQQRQVCERRQKLDGYRFGRGEESLGCPSLPSISGARDGCRRSNGSLHIRGRIVDRRGILAPFALGALVAILVSVFVFLAGRHSCWLAHA